MKIAAVVVTFNRINELKITVARLLASAADTIIVVDNASGDDTPDWLSAQTNPRLHVVTLDDTLFKGTRAGFHMSDADFEPDAGNKPIDVASFVGYFVSRGAIQQAGLPEGGLFIYGDDVLYSLRLRRAGIVMLLMPSVRFEHDCGTMGQGFIYRPLWKIYYHCRNGVSIARQAAGPLIFPAALLWYVTIWWRRGRHYAAHERALYRHMMCAGLRDGLLRRRGRNDLIHQLAAVDKAP